MRTTGFGLSAVMIAAGAVLAWAVTYEADGVDLQQVGLIVFFVGIGLAALTFVFTLAGRSTTVESRSNAVVDGTPVVQETERSVTEHGQP